MHNAKLVPVDLPPGVKRAGTVYQTRGRWYDSSLVRWYEGSMRPWGGWASRTSTPMTGSCRAVLTWSANDTSRYIALGTHSKLYALTPSRTAPVDITPAGFTAGRADAVQVGGYGSGLYGTGLYGAPRVSTSGTVQDASMWTLDQFGQYMVGCMSDDGKIYEWQLDIAGPTAAAVVTNAPTSCQACVVTPEFFLVALGASGNPRNVAWSDQAVETTWSAAATNQAGSYIVQTNGKLMCGKKIRGATLLFTNVDIHLMTYIGLPYVYSIQRIADNCGAISRGCVATSDVHAFWMSMAGFFMFDGSSVQEMPCDVYEAVFSNINMVQRSKIVAVPNTQFSEVIWFYPSSAATENDSYVVYNYQEQHWAVGSLVRLCGADRGVMANPVMVDSGGTVYDHESGYAWGGATPYAESGPVEIGDGSHTMRLTSYITDERTQGDTLLKFKMRDWPDMAETTSASYAPANPGNIRLSSREFRLRVEFQGDGRWGSPRFGVIQGSRR